MAPLWIFLAAAGSSSGRNASDYQMIVHPGNPVSTLDAAFVRDAYLKRTTAWDDGETIRPVDLTPRYPAREALTHDVLGKTLQQLRSYWNQQIFSGKGVPPAELDSEAAVIRYVVSNRGAIGYLPSGVNPGGAKTVPLR